MKRLTGQDAMFLYMETPSMHMHVGGAAVYDTTDAPEPYSFERAIELTRERMHLVPSMTERLAMVPFELHHPVWFNDPDFDLEYHIRRVELGGGAGIRELADVTGDIMSRPLDRNRPLWELYLVEGLKDNRLGVVSKTHHCAVDGVSGVEMAIALMDLVPDPPPIEPPEHLPEPEPKPTDAELIGYALTSLAQQPVKLVRNLGRLAGSLGNMGELRRSRDTEDSQPAPFSAPRTSLNVSVTPHRVASWAEISLDDMKAVKNAAGATVNDVVLATCAGLLDRYFKGRGEVVDADLVAMVPISIRTEDQALSLGNQVSSMTVQIGNTIPDAAERLQTISRRTAAAKEEHDAIGASTLQDWSEFMAPALANRAARLSAPSRIANVMRPPFNITISNVPGPPFALYSFGAKQEMTLPLGPVNEGSALNITVTSYMGTMYFGFHACREAVDDVWSFVTYTAEAFDELKQAFLGTAPTAIDAEPVVGDPAPPPAAKRAAKAAKKRSTKKASTRKRTATKNKSTKKKSTKKSTKRRAKAT